MKHVVLAALVFATAGLVAPAATRAFSQEPVSIGNGDGSRLADRNDTRPNRTQVEAEGPDADARRRFSRGLSGPDPRFAAPVERPGAHNEHLFWNNSSRYWR
jgi:hypothetical protein